MAFKVRDVAPSQSNKYYRHTSSGGLNECILIGGGSALPNCVGYAWGRWYEISGKKPKLSKGNAEDWWNYFRSDGYERGQKPKVGAVICWRKGKVGTGSDGAGHVAIVEKVYDDGSILTSNSAYRSTRFYTRKLSKPYSMSGYTFQGFIYNPDVKSKAPVKKSYVKGNDYKLVANVNVRSGAGTKYKQKTVNQLSRDGRKNATSDKSKAPAVLKKGTVVTAQDVIKKGDDIWLKIPSGYVCAKLGKEVYIK